jgi:hypothetical protein
MWQEHESALLLFGLILRSIEQSALADGSMRLEGWGRSRAALTLRDAGSEAAAGSSG